jgi:hypothetical protein
MYRLSKDSVSLNFLQPLEPLQDRIGITLRVLYDDAHF